ncbi:23S rRNA (uracil(1939)-C(5))-methyltransferase RlmD [Anaerovorax sp. IOR16]|uniref:23S rRNA (uracil(1939)-C(5))-methyltransferase RlmD n=1 Tax=Anaerovorax sp. IOR16 TaxID=2773458 RepID=UPI002ED55111
MEICKHNADCGGCIYQELDYQEQMNLKGKEVVRLLENKNAMPQKFLGIEGSPLQYGYRNKMEYTFGDEVKDGPMTLGMHKRGRFMSIITVDECQLVDSDFNLVLRATLDFCNEKGYGFYHKKSHKGLMRNLVVRKGQHTNELLVNIVTSSQVPFDDAAYVACLQGLPLKNELVGVLHTYNDGIADAVKCDRLEVLYGRDYYNEVIMGLKFKVSAFSFFQTNVLAVEKLYSEAIALIDSVEGKTVFDLYCGTGTITQALALRAKEAIGVEIVEEAVEAAKENAKENGLENCKFIAGDVFKVLETLDKKPDVIVVDPPRVGIHPKAMQKILNYGVKQIVYISCNPKTLAENLDMARLGGYEVKIGKAFDNFPHTKHIEAVILLTK